MQICACLVNDYTKISTYFVYLYKICINLENCGTQAQRERRNLGRDKIEHSEILSQGYPGGFLSLFAVAGTRCRGFVNVHRNIKICKKKFKKHKKIRVELLTKMQERYIFIFTVATQRRCSLTDQGRK